ncbi:MAG: hypothetical protein HPY89_04200 [Pelotomaculum sp.]|nr:hypothetical protein [Pelotomaculum sp.]
MTGFDGNWGGWVFAMQLLFSWLVPLAVIALLVFWAAVWGRERKTGLGNPHAADPLHVLKLRYAKGEISSEEYHRMKEDLKRD